MSTATAKPARSPATAASLLGAGQLAAATVTVHELLRSPSLPAAWRAFWLDFLEAVAALDLDRAAAEAQANQLGARLLRPS